MALLLGPVLFFRGTRDRSYHLCAPGRRGRRARAAAARDRRPARAAAVVLPSGAAAASGATIFPCPSTTAIARGNTGSGHRAGRFVCRPRAARCASPSPRATAASKATGGKYLQERNERWLHLAAAHARTRSTFCCKAATSCMPTRSGTMCRRSPHGSACPRGGAGKPPSRPRWRKRSPTTISSATVAVGPAAAGAGPGDHPLADDVGRSRHLRRLGQLVGQVAEVPNLSGDLAGRAREFRAVPARRPADDLPDGFSDRRGGQFGWAFRIGEVGILAPDLRSERSREQVLGEAGWRSLAAALESMAGCRQVLLVCSMPLVTFQLTALERLFDLLPGHQTWQDDLVDQWPSNAHWEEWTRLLRALVGSRRPAERASPPSRGRSIWARSA